MQPDLNRPVISVRSICVTRAFAQAERLRQEADELRVTGDADMWTLAADLDERADQLQAQVFA